MTTPPKRLSFAQEMELLKQQKAKDAEQARAKTLEQKTHQALRPTQLHAPNTNVEASPDPLLATNLSGVQPSFYRPEYESANDKAMAAALSQYVGNSARKKATSRKATASQRPMLLCTTCRCTTPGERAVPNNSVAASAMHLLGLTTLLGSLARTPARCTHCGATTLVEMSSAQARALCGADHAALMQAGWAEMRRAERDHTRERRLAIVKMLVVAVVVLGASLYIMRT